MFGVHRTSCDHLVIANGIFSEPAVPDYPGIEDDLAEYVRTQEFGSTEVEDLVKALRSLQVPV